MNAIEVFQDWLDDYLNFERNPKKDIFWLDTIDYLCKRFDNPQDYAPCIHVAGTKGKGSVSKMIACILEEAGYNVGLYSSPHIIDFRERISKPNEFFSEKIYEEAIKEMVPNIEAIIPEMLPAERPITWFELVTLFAFLCFRRAKVDWSVYEVGLGGRLDSTNVIRPKICCITPIELEHTEFLGNTLEKIAAEKAGIIKNCTPVVIARQQTDSVKIVFREKAFTKHAPYYFVDEVIKSASYSLNERTKKMKVVLESDMFNRTITTEMSLLGRMQAQNAAMAAITIRKIFPNLDEAIIEKGLAKAKLPGRFEIINKVKSYEGIPQLILDGAHTYRSISLTLDTLNKLYDNKKAILLFACAADKDIKDISKLFKYRFEHIFVTKPGDKKQSDIGAEIEAFTNAGVSFTADSNYKKLIQQAFETASKEGAILLVTGSFYLLSEVKKFLMTH
ncbi:MAG: bifunctional folylpolyglutamate synthase/dihydrofolate synthase [Treponema sp.]|nr:bifunctional folylpolyglutamate synthase/dihydrofolate synthase [Treponema sp.]